MKRVRKEDDGTETIFELMTFKKNGSHRAEIQVASFDELRELKRAGKLIALRMIGTPVGKVTQRNLVPWTKLRTSTGDKCVKALPADLERRRGVLA